MQINYNYALSRREHSFINYLKRSEQRVCVRVRVYDRGKVENKRELREGEQ